MEEMTVLSNLVHLLPKEAVGALLNSSRTLRVSVTQLENNNLYWLRRVENDF
jgi:hypothetical protein